ncbi:MAG: hypothetical protein C0505_13320 [Leptothrix sp. (in: Bacteria)]|nr:hypothetical protein [Leptothrix sp. (in: b-proteobacteria)]
MALALAIVLVGLSLAASRYAALQTLLDDESALLKVQVTAATSSLLQQFQGVRSALIGVSRDLPAWRREDSRFGVARRLDALSAALSPVRSMAQVDANGQAMAVGGIDGIASDQSGEPWFSSVRAKNDPETLVVAAPVRRAAADVTLTLALAITDAAGRFDGAVAATLDTAHFDMLMGSLIHASDTSSRIVHGDGAMLAVVPPEPRPKAVGAAQPNSLFSRHIASGQPVSVLRGHGLAGDDERLMALSTLQPPALKMDRPLVLTVSRSMRVLQAPWRQQTVLLALLWLGTSAAGAVALRWVQRRRTEHEAVQAEQMARQATEAERLRLALWGGDLALWDLDVPGDHATVNERWSTMLGYPPDELDGGGDAWHRLLHPEDRERVLALQQAHLEGRSASFEATYRLRHRQGHWIWVFDRGRVVERDAAGRPLRMVGTHMDVTFRVQAEEELRRSEQKSRGLLATLRAGVVVHAADTRLLEANPAACHLLGLTLDQMRGKAAVDVAWDFLEEDGTPMALSRYPVNQVLAGADTLHNLVAGVRRPDLPSPVWVLCAAFALRDEAGVLQEVVVAFNDITQRKRSEEALQRSASRLRLAGRLARLGGWVLDRASERVDLSIDAAAVVGVPMRPGPLHLDDILALVLPSQRPALRGALQAAEIFDLEVEAVMPTGLELTLRLMGEPVFDDQGRHVAMQGAVQDVTESRREQRQLRLLQTAVAQLNDMVVITEAGGPQADWPAIVFVNAAFERQTGWRADEVLGGTPAMLLSPAADARETARLRDALARCQALRTELLKVGRDGKPCWVDMQIAPLSDAAGRVTHMVAVERDIGDRKRTETQAREAQAALAATLDAVPDLLFEIDLEGGVIDHHSPRSDLLYVPPETFIGRRVDSFLPQPAATIVMQAIRQAHAQGHSSGHQYALPLQRGEHWFELSISRKPTPRGELPRFIVLARDVTERKHGEAERLALERQLREAQKIESIGTLAGGIAHDFNNILPAILGNVALARQDLPADHAALASLEQIQRAAVRARTLVQQILAFSRRQPHELVAQPLQPVLHETLALLRATLPAAVRLDTAISAEPASAAVDATQLQQVLMNLCTNAWHALPEGRGRIEVGLDVVDETRADSLGATGLAAGRCVHVWVSDDGCGMDAGTRDRIFDPFFTTKPVGRGTGLGLSVVHGIVRGHLGCISVESEPGQGSRFHVLLPLVVDAPERNVHRDDAVGVASAGQGEAVWYVDDDPVMALMAQRLLQREGYSVAVFESPAAALAQTPASAPALVITDFNMPGQSGLELAAQLLRRWPGLPIVLSTGQVGDGLHAEVVRHGIRALLRKENTLEELPGLVRRLVGGAPAR